MCFFCPFLYFGLWGGCAWCCPDCDTRCPPPAAQIIKAEIVLWTAGFVLLTLVINAPMLPYVLRWTGLSKGVLS